MIKLKNLKKLYVYDATDAKIQPLMEIIEKETQKDGRAVKIGIENDYNPIKFVLKDPNFIVKSVNQKSNSVNVYNNIIIRYLLTHYFSTFDFFYCINDKDCYKKNNIYWYNDNLYIFVDTSGGNNDPMYAAFMKAFAATHLMNKDNSYELPTKYEVGEKIEFQSYEINDNFIGIEFATIIINDSDGKPYTKYKFPIKSNQTKAKIIEDFRNFVNMYSRDFEMLCMANSDNISVARFPSKNKPDPNAKLSKVAVAKNPKKGKRVNELFR